MSERDDEGRIAIDARSIYTGDEREPGYCHWNIVNVVEVTSIFTSS
jgi:hypothetical protein